jgi:hypothetical protein
MQGWPFVYSLIALEAVAAAFAIGYAARRWADYFIILFGALALLPFIAGSLGGDVSRFLPASTFSPGTDGKDQIVLASAVTALLAAPVLAAAGLIIAQRLWRAAGPDSKTPQ